MRNVSDKSCRENQNIHFRFYIIFSQIVPFMRHFLKICITRQVTDDNTVHVDTHSEYVILTAFPRKKLFARMSFNVTLNARCLHGQNVISSGRVRLFKQAFHLIWLHVSILSLLNYIVPYHFITCNSTGRIYGSSSRTQVCTTVTNRYLTNKGPVQ
jgi:hypothetical protein